MKTRLLASILCLLIANYCYSQTIRVEGSDTVAVIPIELIQSANILFVQGDSLQYENNVLASKVSIRDSLISAYRLTLGTQQNQIRIMDKKISTLDSNLKLKEKEIKTVKRRSLLMGSGAGAILILALIF